MKRTVVTVVFEDGQTICNPARVAVAPGDTVRWTCEEGALAVDFGANTPFKGIQVWAAPRDQMTPLAIVKNDVMSGTVFRPDVSIDGIVVARALGDLIVQ
jgi:hypothetical protein